MAATLPALLGALALLAAPARQPAPEPRFLFDIASPIGAAESTWAALAYDRRHDELFATYGGLVHVFNHAAMESYAFGDDGEVGLVERVAVLESGEMLLLSTEGGRRVIVRADYRGEKLGTMRLEGLPAAFAGFAPDRIQVQGGKLHLAHAGTMRVVVADLAGKVEQTLDLASLVLAADASLKTGMSGFWVDEQGSYVFTMPLAFTAFRVSPARELHQFGSRGSVPGKFNVAGAVAVDEQGYTFVLDRLRSVVMIFDPTLRFLQEFGYRGDGPGNLIAPYDVAVGNGKIFVSQARNRGVKVFQYEVARKPAAAPAGGEPSGGEAPAGAGGEHG